MIVLCGSVIEKIKTFFSRPFFSNPITLFWLWIGLGVISALTKFNKCNNFLVFKYVFWHTWNETSLYKEYPSEYFDVNHYGPLFSLVVAPFAVLPHPLGLLLWHVLLALLLYWTIRKLPIKPRIQVFILWFCAHELLTALFMSQFNIAIAAIIIASFCFIEKEQECTAAFFIVLGTFVKLYGIVGLAFFFFSKHKSRFIFSLLGWSALMYVLPMLISSPEYISGQYVEWYHNLVDKNSANLFSTGQNVSLLGIVRKISGLATYSDLYLIIPGIILFVLPYFRFSQYRNLNFRLAYLASTLLFVVLFSTGSESSSYIISFIGVGIWYWCASWKRGRRAVALMIFAFILTSMSPSDLFPAFLRKTYVHPYALKALPCVVIWLTLIYEMIIRDYDSKERSR